MPPGDNAQVGLAASSAEKLPPFASGMCSLLEETLGMQVLNYKSGWDHLPLSRLTPRILLKEVAVPALKMLSDAVSLDYPTYQGHLWVGGGPGRVAFKDPGPMLQFGGCGASRHQALKHLHHEG